MAGGFFLLADTLTPLLASVHVLENAQDELEGWASEVEAYAQENAPWEDKTGDARDGLTAEVDIQGKDIILSLSHDVDYGIWLETRWSGRFAIIMPTLEHFSGQIMRSVGAVEMGSDFE